MYIQFNEIRYIVIVSESFLKQLVVFLADKPFFHRGYYCENSYENIIKSKKASVTILCKNTLIT